MKYSCEDGQQICESHFKFKPRPHLPKQHSRSCRQRPDLLFNMIDEPNASSPEVMQVELKEGALGEMQYLY